jgi:23S rRNA (adenine2503-C2)-methyltransferase
MPITERHPLPELLDAARRYAVERRRRVTFEYVMMPGINMSAREVRQLAAIGRAVRCKINLIPLNTAVAGSRRPAPEEARAFRRALAEADLEVFDRGSPGREVEGACGMLALRRVAAVKPLRPAPATVGRAAGGRE